MTKRRACAFGLTALVAVALLLIVFGYPRIYSPRMDALEPSLNQFASLDEFRQVAAQNNIPLEPGEPGKPPDNYTIFVVRLDGFMWGETLHLRFRKVGNGSMLDYAVVVGRNGKERLWWRTRW